MDSVSVPTIPPIPHASLSDARPVLFTGIRSDFRRLLMRGAHARHEQLAAHLVHAPRVHTWLDQMLRRWVEGRLAT